MKKAVKLVAESLGYEIRKKSRKKIAKHKPNRIGGNARRTSFHVAMTTQLSYKDCIRIVQIGANDGSLNDPIFEFIAEFPQRTEVLLVEPQKYLIPYLEKNYTFHPNYKIFNGAVGDEESLVLYSVKKDFWDSLSVPYARRGWPKYRVPTGVTSYNKEHVRKWLHKHLWRTVSIDSAISESLVPSASLVKIMHDLGFPESIDVLQVDTEGFDDQVIYQCSLENTKPHLINFESSHLADDRYEKLLKFLRELGYITSRNGRDTLAVLIRNLKSGKGVN